MEQLINLHRPLNVCRASAGTGKTFTLAAYYVGLLLSGESYRSILAVTFTNNATSEMKERIMGYLYELQQGKNAAFLAKARTFMIARHNDTDAVLRARAGECFRQMLLDYDNVHVQTIDSFLLTLQNGLAAVLKMSAGYTPELDLKRVVTQAVDQMLSTDMSEVTRQLLVSYVKANLEEEDNSDIRAALIGMANALYNESVQMLETEGRLLTDAEAIEAYRERLDAAWQHDEDRQRLHSLVTSLEAVDPSIPNGKYLNSAIENLRMSLHSIRYLDKKVRFRGLTDSQLNNAESGKWSKLPETVVKQVVEATYVARRCLITYNTYTLSREFTYDLQLMSELRALIRRNLAEMNKTLLARTADRLCRALKKGDADFILEKAGIRYHHVLLDEFQDTSQLQWSVFDLLVKELVAGEGNTILVVGDIKQSIYRWRNGDWHTMDQLGKENDAYHAYLNPDFPRLVRNFRSSREVVEFNLSLFKHICEVYPFLNPEDNNPDQIREIYDEGYAPDQIDAFYRSGDERKEGGYVNVCAFQRDGRSAPTKAIVTHMLDQMERVLQAGGTPEQMMVLVRDNKEIARITDQWDTMDAAQYPLLSQVPLATESSYLLSASADVQLIIAVLYCLATPQTHSLYEQIIRQRLPNTELASLLKGLHKHGPLFETVCDILRLCLCDEQGHYTGSEHAYINTFLDHVRAYVASEGGNTEEFLRYWEETLRDQSIPMNAVGAIRIMTVHKSKGLEAPTLFVPFCNWDAEVNARKENKVWCESVLPDEEGNPVSLPIRYSSEMKQSAYAADYENERHNSRIDNLNLLYVALTRARDNLFIYTDCDAKGQTTTIGQYVLSFIGVPDDAFANGEAYYAYEKGQLTIRTEQVSEDGPFDFVTAPTQQAQLWSDGRQVHFVQSTDSLQYAEHGEEAARLAQRKEIGTICHEVFARLTQRISSKSQWQAQLNAILDEFETQGLIESEKMRKEVFFLVHKAWSDPQMQHWFITPYIVKAEQALYMDGKEYRPDRVMIDQQTGKAIVLDYKFGTEHDNEYSEQVHRYMRAMQLMGHKDVEGYLWYARTGELVAV